MILDLIYSPADLADSRRQKTDWTNRSANADDAEKDSCDIAGDHAVIKTIQALAY